MNSYLYGVWAFPICTVSVTIIEYINILAFIKHLLDWMNDYLPNPIL